MKKYTVEYQPKAEDDLVDILLYYAEQCGYAFSEGVQQRIENHIDLLEHFPYRTIENPNIPKTRILVIDKLPYKAYFMIDEDKQEVRILRIIHDMKKTITKEGF